MFPVQQLEALNVVVHLYDANENNELHINDEAKSDRLNRRQNEEGEGDHKGKEHAVFVEVVLRGEGLPIPTRRDNSSTKAPSEPIECPSSKHNAGIDDEGRQLEIEIVPSDNPMNQAKPINKNHNAPNGKDAEEAPDPLLRPVH